MIIGAHCIRELIAFYLTGTTCEALLIPICLGTY